MKSLQFLVLGVLAILAVSCSNVPGLTKTDEVKLTQFSDGIIDFSTEFGAAPGPWSSFVILGAPDTYPEYGDKVTAWASKTRDDQDEFITVAFDTAQYVNNISIYETYNPGAVSLVSVRNMDNGSWVPVYSDGITKDLPEQARIMEISFPTTDFLVDAIKVNVASTRIPGWNEIDAISISGFYEED